VYTWFLKIQKKDYLVKDKSDISHLIKNIDLNFIINRKVLVGMLFIGLSMLGYLSYKQLPVELYPNAQLPMLFVQVGAGVEVDPKYMESQAIIPLEGAIGTLEGVEEINSTAGQQQGRIQISFRQSPAIFDCQF